jgi:hypothetical protein
MLTQTMILNAQSVIEAWLPRYPTAAPWVNDAAGAALRSSEDAWLKAFSGADRLTRSQVGELIDWKWNGYPARRAHSKAGVDEDWHHADGCIRAALAATNRGAAVDALCSRQSGIPNWRPAMSSVVLAVCKPDDYSIADSRALRTLMMLRGAPSSTVERIRQFPRTEWENYQEACGELANVLDHPRRDLDRAFWAAAGRLR